MHGICRLAGRNWKDILFYSINNLYNRVLLNVVIPITIKQVDTYQVKHILLWFGNVELHLIFNKEFKSQVVLCGIELVSLGKKT